MRYVNTLIIFGQMTNAAEYEKAYFIVLFVCRL